MKKRGMRPDMSGMASFGNPLTDTNFRIIVRKRTKVEYNEKGERLSVDIELEHERYVKLFVASDKRKAMSGLSSPARGLFMWLLYELESGKDFIWINRGRYMEEMGIGSINTYKSGVVELVQKKLIAVSLLADVFWINPRLFFCGSRVNKYPENVVLYEAKVEEE